MAGLFPPQTRDWALPSEAPLTPAAAERLAREAAVQSFANAGRALGRDWGRVLDGTQVRRWAEALGRSAVRRRGREVVELERGVRPAAPANGPALLVVEVDGGRVQERDEDPDTNSRWHEDKVCTVTTYLPGDGRPAEDGGRPPRPLVTTHVATMGKTGAFGRLCRVEAERRGLRQAAQVLALGDAGNWIDPLLAREFRGYARIVDWRHAQEHLWDVARAACADGGGGGGADPAAVAAMAEPLEALLWDGRVADVIARVAAESQRAGPPRDDDGKEHPRRVLAQNVGYFTTHGPHMDYPEYRRRGWPIGSGVVESGVKQFNRRVKGSDQFWNEDGVEPILAVRGLWLSQDERWDAYWLSRPAYEKPT